MRAQTTHSLFSCYCKLPKVLLLLFVSAPRCSQSRSRQPLRPLTHQFPYRSTQSYVFALYLLSYSVSSPRLSPVARDRPLKLREGPDLHANGFSARNAFFFSHLSSTMYLTPDLVEAHFRQLGITEFFWFSVSK